VVRQPLCGRRLQLQTPTTSPVTEDLTHLAQRPLKRADGPHHMPLLVIGRALARERREAQRLQPPIAMKTPRLAMCCGKLFYKWWMTPRSYSEFR
jgi:hypothetical protein